MNIPAKRTVFLVHGRDHQAKVALEELLRAFDLKVITWRRAATLAGGGSPYTGDIVDAGIKNADAVVVLLTPDDVGYLRPTYVKDRDGADDQKPTGQPRMNVVFEAGMAMAWARGRTVLVEIGAVRRISDLDGVNVVRLDGSIESRKSLAARLVAAGLAVDMEDDGWRDAGTFTSSTLQDEDLAPVGGRALGPPSAGAARGATPVSGGKGEAYLEFWRLFLDRVRSDDRAGWARARDTRRDNWVSLASHRYRQYVVGFVQGGRLRCELYIDSGNADMNLEILLRFADHRDEIESMVGEPLSWEELPEKRACRIAAYRPGDVLNTGAYAEYTEWFLETALRFHAAFETFAR